jgi:hypothetical protein
MSTEVSPSRRRLLVTLTFVLAVAIFPARADAGIVYNVSFVDPGGAFAPFYAPITSHTLAAGQDWASHFSGNASLEVIVHFTNSIPRATGRSVTSSFVHTNGPINVFEQGAAAEIRTGIDPNGAEPDIELQFNPGYLANELWFDPNPFLRSDPVPGNRTDAVSVFLHELGHAFSFNGWRDSFNGTLPGNFESPFDELTFFNGRDFFFFGPQATALYGGPVPLTFGNIFHLGNSPPRPGSDLIPDLMNGVVFFRGARYHISELDLAITADVGLPTFITAVPEPSSIALVTLGSAVLIGYWRRKGNRATKASA